jgi:hypothetical protein
MIALIVILVALAAIAASVLGGRDSRELDTERGWWPAYRRDQLER